MARCPRPHHRQRTSFPSTLLAASLALGVAAAQAQTAPTTPQAGRLSGKASTQQPAPRSTTIHLDDSGHHTGSLPVLYVDGQRRDSTAFASLNPHDIARVEVMKGDAAGRVSSGLGPDEAQRGVLFVTTKAGEHSPAVGAFNQRLSELAEAAPHTPGTPASPRIRTGAWPPIPSPLYYVDGQRADSAALKAQNPNDIASIEVLKGAAAEALNPSAKGRGVVAVTTKLHEKQPAVLAFNQQLAQQRTKYAGPPEQAGGEYQPADVRYYLNGQPSSRAAVSKIDPHAVTGLRTLHGRQATNYTHDPSVTEVFVITTRL